MTLEPPHHPAVLENLPGKLSKLALTGSRAYGTHRVDSDYDYRGFYVADTADFWKLRKPTDTVDRKDPDLTLFEVEKFVRLAAGANPNVLEMLWAEPIYQDCWAEMLFDNRHAFLSKKVAKTYGGYAISQLAKAQKGTGGSRGRNHFKREKFVLHLFRLMMAGTELLRTGELSVKVEDPELLWRLAKLPLNEVEREFKVMDVELTRAEAASDLPEQPDWAEIDRMLNLIREARWRSSL